MTPKILPLEKCTPCKNNITGGKATNLARLIGAGFRVPSGICVTTPAYKEFANATGAGAFVSYELGRKSLQDMRWEEMWDASLRIRNYFLKADMPQNLKTNILKVVHKSLPGKPLVIRSSSSFEDSAINSFAGLHESFLNIKGDREIIRHIKLVWASLWSDSAIAYSRELGLDTGNAGMSVIIQEMVSGDISGVAFGTSPVDESAAIIESVPGLNKGLVDGDVEPDRWIIEKTTGKIRSSSRSKDNKRTVATGSGTRTVQAAGQRTLLMSTEKVGYIYRTLTEVEKKMRFVPDMEWTIRGDEVYLLQVRPISAVKFQDSDKRRGWDMTLRRSFDNLKSLSARITGKLIPELIADAESMEKMRLATLDNRSLATELDRRQKLFVKWTKTYKDEFIPFAHGARLFGQVYNDRIKPEDPHEFAHLLSSEKIISVARNRRLGELAAKLRATPELIDKKTGIVDETFKTEIFDLSKELDSPGSNDDTAKATEKNIISLLVKMAEAPTPRTVTTAADKDALEKKFLATFKPDELAEATELLDLARLSYKLRDDDNVYLGRVESGLAAAMHEARKRLEQKNRSNASAKDSTEKLAKALAAADGCSRQDIPSRSTQASEEQGEKRQLRGQPAGKGIARGKARIINSASDLFEIQPGEVLVSDSIDPRMTFVIPVVAGIVERRGGMLIHGAIIAREYGIPCVTGVENAATQIKTGDELTVDGYFGLVINHSVGE